jgi:hypothetical protein
VCEQAIIFDGASVMLHRGTQLTRMHGLANASTNLNAGLSFRQYDD